jgi:hypothetical protein
MTDPNVTGWLKSAASAPFVELDMGPGTVSVVSIPPEDAQPGDPCGLLIATGADGQADICPGTLDPSIDVHGKVPGCSCHLHPPCNACLEAPLACATCLETVP